MHAPRGLPPRRPDRPGPRARRGTSPCRRRILPRCQRLLAAEDARGTGPDGLAPLLDARSSPDTLLRRIAVRGLGRMQRPALGRLLVPLLRDSVRGRARRGGHRDRTVDAAGTPHRFGRGRQRGFTTKEAASVLTEALAAESDPGVRDALAQSLGRLPLPDSASAREAESAIRAALERHPGPGVVHGLYTLARARKATGDLGDESVALLRKSALASSDTLVRRLALRTLATAGGLDSATAVRAIRDRDDESRRMTLRGAGALSPTLRAALVRDGFRDPASSCAPRRSPPRVWATARPIAAPSSRPRAIRVPAVALTAVDSLGSGCADTAGAAAVLRRLAATPVPIGPPDHRWQMPAHSLLALARFDRSAAAGLVPSAAGADRWETRVYAARAAALTTRRPPLYALSRDADRNVQEAAIGASPPPPATRPTAYIFAP